VLWFFRHISGVVDEEAASIGPRSMDVAHCRINLLHAVTQRELAVISEQPEALHRQPPLVAVDDHRRHQDDALR
jgi:hypothetical protein